MKLARAIHFDESDMNVFHSPARTGEWCISGGFEFSNWGEGDLEGKARQAFANGWLGVETFGRVTFVAVTQVEPALNWTRSRKTWPNTSFSSTVPRRSMRPWKWRGPKSRICPNCVTSIARTPC